MDLTSYQHTETTTIAASPEAVYELVADITRMGQWSPVVTSAEWADDARTQFTGTNSAGGNTWTTTCRVDTATPGKEFTFVNRGADNTDDLVRWSYTFVPAGTSTEVSEHWQVLPGFAGFLNGVAPNMDVTTYLDGVVGPTQDGMRQTLANLKAGAEG